MTQRYLRTASEALYEQIRLQLDSAWQHPTDHTVTCIDPAGVAPRDAEGRILLAVQQEFMAFPAAAELLPDLLADGSVEEITASEYMPVSRSE